MRAVALVVVLTALPASAAEPIVTWSERVGGELAGPVAATSPAAAFYARCGSRSAALEAVSVRLLFNAEGGLAKPSAATIAHAVEASGVTQPHPRAWAFAGDPAAALTRFASWLAPARGERRCGLVVRPNADGTIRVAALAIDALAEVSPLARRMGVGSWVALEARLAVEVEGVAVVLLPPDGEPRRVLADRAGDRARSRFALDRPGEWKVQLLATLAGGPEPVAEARLFAGVEPASGPVETPPLGLGDDEALARSLVSARVDHGLAPLRRSAELDRVAAAHSARMAAAGTLAHDVGDGSPAERVRESGVAARLVGENVARAADGEAAHRALWDSPSHRANMLSRRFGRFGLGVVRDARGVWVTEVFAD